MFITKIYRFSATLLFFILFSSCSFFAQTTLTAPSDGHVVPASVPGLRWEPVNKAQSYKLQVAEDQSFSDIVLESDAKETSITPDEPLADGLYYWRVKPVFENGHEGRWSSALAFTVKEQIPEWISPASGTELAAGTGGVLEWSSVPEANYYSVEWDSGTGNPVVFLYDDTGADTQGQVLEDSLEGGDYAVRIRAHFPWGAESPWSVPHGITLKHGYSHAFNAPGHYQDGNWKTTTVFFSADGHRLDTVELKSFYTAIQAPLETGELLVCGYYSDSSEYDLWAGEEEIKGIPAIAVFSQKDDEAELILLTDYPDLAFYALEQDRKGLMQIMGRLGRQEQDRLISFSVQKKNRVWETENISTFVLYSEKEDPQIVTPLDLQFPGTSHNYLLGTVQFNTVDPGILWTDPRKSTLSKKGDVFLSSGKTLFMLDLENRENEDILVLDENNLAVEWYGFQIQNAEDSRFWLWGVNKLESTLVLQDRNFEGDIEEQFVLPVPEAFGPLLFMDLNSRYLLARHHSIIVFNPQSQEASIRHLTAGQSSEYEPLILDWRSIPEGLLVSGCLISGETVVDNWLLMLDSNGDNILRFYSSGNENYSLSWR